MLRERASDASDADSLRIINRSGEHLLAMINSVLDLAKIESHKFALELREFDLGMFLRDIVDIMRRRAEEKGLSLSIDQTSSFPRCVRADREKLRQVLFNIIGNAIKFTAAGSVSVRLNTGGVSQQDGSSRLHFTVTDTGAGIHPDDLERIFAPFEQATHRPKAEGTGLGLALSKEFVRLMGGEIRVKSDYGHGSTFGFDIAYTPVDEEAIHRIDLPPSEIAGITGAKGMRVLIVEDEETNRGMLKKILDPYGFDLAEAENGQEGVRIAAEWRPDLILMDRRMPIMDGITAVRRIRELPDAGRIRIVAVTAEAFHEDYTSMMAAGCDAFIRKPYKVDELLGAIGALLPVTLVHTATEPPGSGDVNATGDYSVARSLLAELPSLEIEELRRACTICDGQAAAELVSRHKDLAPLLAPLFQAYQIDVLEGLLPVTLMDGKDA
jgi:CheY-like chemotaxis protein